MSLLTEDQRQRLREGIYTESRSCYNCMPVEAEGTTNYTIAHWTLGESINENFSRTQLENEVDFDLSDNDTMQQLIDELDLHCPRCGAAWTDQYDELGGNIPDPETFRST